MVIAIELEGAVLNAAVKGEHAGGRVTCALC